jgi:FkbM family methyltransferase
MSKDEMHRSDVLRSMAWHFRERSLLYAALRAARAKHGRSRFGEPEFRYLDILVDTNRPAINVGANLGFYTFRLARLASRVIAVEPNAHLVQRLRFAAAMTRSRNVSVVQTAVGAINGSGSFVIPLAADGTRDFGQAHIGVAGEDGLPVSLERLDDLARVQSAANAGFIKIDVEGGELDVFRGATRLLADARPVVLCEVQEQWCRRYGHTAAHVFAYMAKYDYTATTLEGSRFVEIAVPQPDLVDYVFFPDTLPTI